MVAVNSFRKPASTLLSHGFLLERTSHLSCFKSYTYFPNLLLYKVRLLSSVIVSRSRSAPLTSQYVRNPSTNFFCVNPSFHHSHGYHATPKTDKTTDSNLCDPAWFRFLPSPVIPFLRLIRFEKPIGRYGCALEIMSYLFIAATCFFGPVRGGYCTLNRRKGSVLILNFYSLLPLVL